VDELTTIQRTEMIAIVGQRLTVGGSQQVQPARARSSDNFKAHFESTGSSIESGSAKVVQWALMAGLTTRSTSTVSQLIV